MLNDAGYITDGSGENVFLVRDGVLFTPPTQAGCLDGITRGIGDRRSAREREYVVREENLVRTDLYLADEGFFTGTAAELTPIREVDDRQVGAGHRGAGHQAAAGRLLRGHEGRGSPAHASWLTYVND